MKDELFWVGQKAFIKKRNKILVLTDSSTGKIDFPGGRLQNNEENLEKALYREIKEEVGLKVKVEKPFCAWIRKFPSGHKYFGKKVFLVGYRCKYLSGKIKITDAHSDFKWVDKKTFISLDDGSEYYQLLVKYFE